MGWLQTHTHTHTHATHQYSDKVTQHTLTRSRCLCYICVFLCVCVFQASYESNSKHNPQTGLDCHRQTPYITKTHKYTHRMWATKRLHLCSYGQEDKIGVVGQEMLKCAFYCKWLHHGNIQDFTFLVTLSDSYAVTCRQMGGIQWPSG